MTNRENKIQALNRAVLFLEGEQRHHARVVIPINDVYYLTWHQTYQYSQLELKIVSHFLKLYGMVVAFDSDADIWLGDKDRVIEKAEDNGASIEYLI